MNIVNGQLQIPGVVQLIDSTGGGVPVVLHLHHVGPGEEDFDWLPESEGRYEFPDIFKAWAACPVLLENEQERRRQEQRPWEKLQVNALVLDGSGVVRRSADGHGLPEKETKPMAEVMAAGTRAARRSRGLGPASAKANGTAARELRVPALRAVRPDEVFERTAARLGEHEEVAP